MYRVPGEVLSRQRTSVRHHLRQCSGEHDTAAVHEAAQERPWFRGMLPDAADTGWKGHDAARVPQQNKPHSFNTDNVHYVNSRFPNPGRPLPRIQPAFAGGPSPSCCIAPHSSFDTFNHFRPKAR